MHVFYRASYLLFYVSGHLAAWLAERYRAIARCSDRLGLVAVPLQFTLLVAWFPARAVSLGSFAVCRSLAPRVT
jgi:hypothetical protein